MTENVAEKAVALLAAGRLTVDRRERDRGGLIVATCHGDHGIYRLGFDPTKNQWRCTCEARGLCSHLFALQLCTGYASEKEDVPE